MKIKDVKAIRLAIPTKKTGIQVPWVWGARTIVIVEVTTEDGLTGYGEAFGYGAPEAVTAVVNHTLRPHLIGQDARDIAGLNLAMYQKTHLWGRYGITTFGISGVDIALWDLAGKRAGMPLADLLGGASSREVPAYASLVRYEEGAGEISEHAAQAVREGYGMIKLHQSAVESVALAREAIGDEMPLTVDINCQWSPLKSTEMAIAMDEYDLTWLEEPVWPPEDFAGLAAVQEGGGVPLAAGENACTAHQFQAMAEAGAVSYMQPSATKVGGISEFLKVATLAETFNLGLAPHSPYFGPGFLATLHLIAHCGRARWVEKIYFDLEVSPFSPALEPVNGVYQLPDGPGLGLELNADVVKEFSIPEE
ncbi:MAG: mandelate racemase/muconate lactonizing enzyme family protein [bacterium]